MEINKQTAAHFLKRNFVLVVNQSLRLSLLVLPVGENMLPVNNQESWSNSYMIDDGFYLLTLLAMFGISFLGCIVEPTWLRRGAKSVVLLGANYYSFLFLFGLGATQEYHPLLGNYIVAGAGPLLTVGWWFNYFRG